MNENFHVCFLAMVSSLNWKWRNTYLHYKHELLLPLFCLPFCRCGLHQHSLLGISGHPAQFEPFHPSCDNESPRITTTKARSCRALMSFTGERTTRVVARNMDALLSLPLQRISSITTMFMSPEIAATRSYLRFQIMF